MRNEIHKAHHKVFRLKYHFVFCIKYRKDLFLEDKYVETVKQTLKGLEERYHLTFETMGFDEDHVHFMLESIPSYSPSKIFQVVKSITAIELFKRHPDLKEELWGGEFWSDGGHIDTVGDGRGLDEVRKYVLSQGRNVSQLTLHEFVRIPHSLL